ncbi:hypothetical protein [Hymenobacter baengnokdamensis]|uniref:hypothetical protein n=1 Tax=Hymenobacter baengnokdamensis TaxID=2615203 RepID=UPI0012456EC1|nr:hypothetical protein [Hymenobacter baengnokdamensis]
MAPVFSPTVIFENAAGRILTDPGKFLRLHWKPNARTLADTQALMQHLTQALQQYGWGKVLGNQVEILPYSPEEQAWITTTWLPHAVQHAGYRVGAILVSVNLYARLATAYITTNVQGLSIRFRSFDKEAEAEVWLRHQE